MRSRTLYLVLALTSLIGCGGGSSMTNEQPPGSAPIITSSNSILVDTLSDWSVRLEANDQDGDPLNWQLADEGDASAFTLTASGTLTFTGATTEELLQPREEDRTFNVTVIVSDGTYETSQTLTITAPPPPPEASFHLEERLVTVGVADNTHERTYWLARSTDQISVPMPVVFFFHGAYGDYRLFLEEEKVQALIRLNEFLGVFLSSSGDTWALEGEATVSDIEFVRAVIRDLQAVPNADLFALFAVGFSNGGVMASEAAQVLANFAGIALINGHLREDQTREPLNSALSVVQISGTLDETIPFTGGTGFDGKPYVSALDSAEYWATQMDCDAATLSESAAFGDYAVNDRDYASCNNGHHVWLREIEEVGHVRRLNESASLPDFIWSRLAP